MPESIHPNKPTIRYSFLRILTGSDLSRRRLAKMEARSGREGPVVWLTACAHGDEVGGIVVIQEVFKRLKRFGLECGDVHAFPLMNPMGFEVGSRHVSMSGEDLNRSFPGRATGSVAQRLAATIFSEITATEPAAVLDLHNDWRFSIPYVVMDPPVKTIPRPALARSRVLAIATGLSPVAETMDSPEAGYAANTISGSLLAHGIPALTLELGEAYVVNEKNVDIGVTAVWNVLLQFGMVSPIEPKDHHAAAMRTAKQVLTYSSQPVSSSSGILRYLVQPGDIVEPDQPIARIYNAFGKLVATLRAPRRALVLAHAESAVAFPGAPVIAFGIM
jgi:hypothetical protein